MNKISLSFTPKRNLGVLPLRVGPLHNYEPAPLVALDDGGVEVLSIVVEPTSIKFFGRSSSSPSEVEV